MVFAFHTVEAYVNFAGEIMAPELWRDERNSFRDPPYRGWTGKLRKLMETVGLPWLDEERPLKTVLELKDLRDFIAHGRSEVLDGTLLHDEPDMPYPTSKLRSLFTPKRKMPSVLPDVETFLNEIHVRVKPNVQDPWFGSEALRGPRMSLGRSTSLSPKD